MHIAAIGRQGSTEIRGRTAANPSQRDPRMTAPTARTTLVATSHLFLADQRMGLAQLFCIGPSVVEARPCRSRSSGGLHGSSAVGIAAIERQSVGAGMRGSVRWELGGARTIKKN